MDTRVRVRVRVRIRVRVGVKVRVPPSNGYGVIESVQVYAAELLMLMLMPCIALPL